MRRVLNREVLVEGTTMPAGFPVSDLPPDAQSSILQAGWYRWERTPVPVKDDAGATEGPLQTSSDESSKAEDDAKANDSDAKAPESATNASETAKTAANELGDAKPIADFKDALDPELIKLLAAAKILTVGDAKTHLVNNKTFRTVDGIGKASDAKIREALNL